MRIRSENSNMGMRCIKYMLIIINIMFALTATLLITVGTAIQAIYGDFSQFLDDHFFSPPTLLVAIGAIMLVVAVYGCLGAFKESVCMINFYGLLLGMILILEIAAAISAFALQPQVEDMLIRTMNDSIHLYNEVEYIADAVDFMQQNLACCGINSPMDWDGVLPDGDGSTLISIPPSCCNEFSSTLPKVCEVPFPDGCLDRMHFIIAQSAMLIATGATTVAFVQILGVICAFMLAKTVRRTKSIRAARKWQLQQSLGILDNNSKPSYDAYTQLEKAQVPNESVVYK